MKAVALTPGVPGSLRLIDIPEPSLSSIPDGRGVLVRVVRVGVDGTDRELIQGRYGRAPEWSDSLIIGHENLGIVEAVGERVGEVTPGDFVVGIVRLPGTTIYDRIGAYDMTTDRDLFERGINRMNGFLTEYFVDSPEFLVRIPSALREAGILLEPLSVVEKGVDQAYHVQQRLQIWQPQRAAVLGAGPIGLLAALHLRLRGLDVCTFSRAPAPNLRSERVVGIGGCYHSIGKESLRDAAAEHGPFDIIFEATGHSPLAFEAMEVLGPNGILILSSVTGGGRRVELPTDLINRSFVLGNKAVVGTVSSNRGHFESAIRDITLAEFRYPGWLEQLLTNPVNGLASYRDLVTLLESPRGAGTIKVYCEVSRMRP